MRSLRLRLVSCLALCSLFLAVGLFAQEKQEKTEPPKTAEPTVLAGHSYHGEVFNEGPRQKAYLMGGTGDVSFPVTTKSPEAQQFFNQGLGQVYGFWYFEAERSFRQVAALDAGAPISSNLAYDALLNEVLAKNPMHPVHHFRIHHWDYEKADLALNSAARCGQSAPAIAHMWH